MVILPSASRNTIPAIARLVQGGEDAIRALIHWFNQMGLACLDPQWAGGRRRISNEDEAFIIATAHDQTGDAGPAVHPVEPVQAAAYLAHNRGSHRVQISRERLRQLLAKHEITFQRTKTWKEPADPQRDANLARIEERSPPGSFAFDEFGPLAIRPHADAGWAADRAGNCVCIAAWPDGAPE